MPALDLSKPDGKRQEVSISQGPTSSLPASPAPSFAQTYPNPMGGQTQTASNEQFPQGGGFQAGRANLMGGQTQAANHEQSSQGEGFQAA